MDWTLLAEERIAAALAEGEPAPLPGAGRPLNLDAYFALPAEWRAGMTLLKNAGAVPTEVALLRQVADLREQLNAASAEARPTLRRELLAAETAAALALEKWRLRSGFSPATP